MLEAAGPKKQHSARDERLRHVKRQSQRSCIHELRFKLRYKKCMSAKCPCRNHQDQTASGDGATSQSENSLNFVNVGNVIPFPLAQNVHLASGSSTTYSHISSAPGELNQMQSHDLNLTKVGQTLM